MSTNNNNLCRLTVFGKNKVLNPPEVSDLIVLDINNEDKSDKYSYFKRNNYKEYALCTGNYVNKIQQDGCVIWESSNINDYTHLVLLYDGHDKQIVIVPYEGNLILLNKLDNGSWTTIKTSIDLNKLQMFRKNGNALKIGCFYYDLELFKVKIIFDLYCEAVIYDRMLIYNHCDKPIHGHPYSLCFNLLDSTISFHFTDESILTFQNLKTGLSEISNFHNSDRNNYSYNPSHFTVDDNFESYNIEEIIKHVMLYGYKRKDICLFYKNFYDESIDIEAEHSIIDANLIMSTKEYVTYCFASRRLFYCRQGYYFGKIINRSPDEGNSDLPQYCYTKIITHDPSYLLPENRDLEYEDKYTDLYGSIKPDITKFKFYKAEDIEISSDDYEVSYDDFFYVIKFKTDLYKVIYDGKEYWNYINDKMNGFPSKIYFTDYNNDMNVCFNNGKIQKVKIKVHLLQFYTTDELGNTVRINDNYYRVTKSERHKLLYKFKDGVKCTEIRHYSVELVWKHKKGESYPISIDYDYEFLLASIRFEKYFVVSVRGRSNTFWSSLLFQFPRPFKLYHINEYSEIVELNEKDYVLTCDHFGDFRYKMKNNVKCVEIKLGDVTLWRHEKSQPYPHTVAYLFFPADIGVNCKGLNIWIRRNKGIWNTKICVIGSH